MMTLITLFWFKTLCLELNFSLIIKKTIIYAYMCYRQTLNVAKKIQARIDNTDWHHNLF